MRRVAITGIGLITPLGVGADATWEGLMEGRSAIGPLSFDASSLRTQVGGEVSDLDVDAFVSRKAQRTMTRADVLAVAGATLALQDAELEVSEAEAERAALFTAGNKEISDPSDMLAATLAARGDDGRVDLHRFGIDAQSAVHPLFYVQGLQAASLFYISQQHGLKGANTYFAGGAESGATAIGRAFRSIRRGEADIAVAGGFDDAVTWWNMSKLDATGMLSPGECRPYDRDREGTLLGEGAAFLVLEESERARMRGARVYAELTGFGSGFDARNLVTPDPDGESLSRALTGALNEARLSPDAVSFVAAHGSGTRLGDVSEARAIARSFGDVRPAASTVKPVTGHLVGGAGALNAAVAALALSHGALPQTLGLEDLDPDCDTADWVTGAAREVRGDAALAVARGVEGQSVALAMYRHEPSRI
ncbi:MAG TPA: beta-ketoacyl-[acyl-carrier-protein] synthase family protein [Solirubrobacter sp.]